MQKAYKYVNENVEHLFWETAENSDFHFSSTGTAEFCPARIIGHLVLLGRLTPCFQHESATRDAPNLCHF